MKATKEWGYQAVASFETVLYVENHSHRLISAGSEHPFFVSARNIHLTKTDSDLVLRYLGTAGMTGTHLACIVDRGWLLSAQDLNDMNIYSMVTEFFPFSSIFTTSILLKLFLSFPANVEYTIQYSPNSTPFKADI